MEPRLVIINGPCGIGKSTLAERYIDDHPLALKLDIDNIWAMMGRWREHVDASNVQKMRLAHTLAERHLFDGYDVVVPNILQAPDLGHFDAIAQKCGALLCEYALMTDKDEAIVRFIRRGQSEGNPTGFRPHSTTQRAGGVTKLVMMYDGLQQTLLERPNCTVIEPIYGDVEATYEQIIEHMPLAAKVK